MAIVTQTDRPKSVCNRCEIEVFGGVFVLSRCFLDFSVGVGVFFHRTESDLFRFLLKYFFYKITHFLKFVHLSEFFSFVHLEMNTYPNKIELNH